MATTTTAPSGERASPLTYEELYGSLSSIPTAVDSQVILQQFRTSGDAPMSNEQLLQGIKDSHTVTPLMVVMKVKDRNQLVVLHRPMVFQTAMGSPTNDWSGKILMWNGDMVDGQVPQHVFLPKKAFEVKQEVKVWSSEECLRLFGAGDINEHGLLASVPDEAPEDHYSLVKTRTAMYVPWELAGYFLQENPTAKEALKKVAEVAAEADASFDYEPLLDWLRCVCIETGVAIVQRGSYPDVPPHDQALKTNLLEMARSDLPSLGNNNSNTSQDEVVARMVRAASSMEGAAASLAHTSDNFSSPAPAGARGTREAATKTPSDEWPNMIKLLVRFADVSTENELPELWKAWATSKKEQRRMNLQNLLRLAARDMTGFPVPVATESLTKVLYDLAFPSMSLNDLSMGLQPFQASYENETDLVNRYLVNDLHDELKTARASLQDIYQVKAAAKLSFPTTELYFHKSIKSFAVILCVAIGKHHPLTKAYMEQIVTPSATMSESFELFTSSNKLAPELFYVHILRAIQIKVNSYWLDLFNTNTRVPAPDFSAIYQKIRELEWNPPFIPPRYLQKATQRNQSGPAASRDTSQAGGHDSTLGGRQENSDSSKGSYVRNADPDQRLLDKGKEINQHYKLGDFMWKLKNSESFTEELPVDGNGKTYCFSWHTKGGCMSNCNRLKNNTNAHGRVTPGEVTKIVNYIDKGLLHLQQS